MPAILIILISGDTARDVNVTLLLGDPNHDDKKTVPGQVGTVDNPFVNFPYKVVSFVHIEI